MKRSLNELFLPLLLLSFSVLASPARSVEPETPAGSLGSAVRIAVIQSLTGVAAVDGNTVVNSARLAAEHINSDPSLPALELSIQDDQSDAKSSLSAFHQVLVKKPDAVLGGTWSFIINALSPLAMQTKTVVVNSSTIPECVEPQRYGGYVFTMTASAAVEDEVFAPQLVSGRTAVILTGPTSYSEAHRKAFTEIAARKGVKILEDIRYDSIASLGAEALIPKIKKLKPDFLFLILVPEAFDPFIRRLHELKVHPQIVADKNGYHAFQTAKDKAAFEGICISYPVEPFRKNPQFVSLYRKRYGEEPRVYADVSYDAVMLLYKTTFTARSLGQPVAAVLPEMRYTGIAGTYTYFDGRFHADSTPSLVCIKNGAASVTGVATLP